jgi:hypothetical protein
MMREAVVLVATALLAGCVLLVDVPANDFAAHCAFAGRGSDCGKCLVQRCQSALDACCGDGWCGGLMAQVEGCAATGDARCSAVRAAAASAQGDAAKLAACLAEPCRGACAPISGTSSSHCGDTRFGLGTACACTVGTAALPANTYACDSQTFPDTRCCAPATWPSVGTECSCLAVSCGPVRDGCSCFLSDAFDPSATRECRGDFCCQTASACRCGSQPCTGSEVAVASCGAATTPCAAKTVTLDRCSLP